MERVLEMMAAAVAETWAAAAPFLAGVPPWVWAAAGTVVLLLTAIAIVRPDGSPKPANRPEMMLSRAEMAPDPDAEGRYQLVAAFSNLHHGPVQLLRIAAVGGDGQMAVVETTALVMARRAVELEADLPIAGGGKGRLELYLYVPSSSARAWRLRVPLVWEPWSRRYKATPLDQRLDPVTQLPEPPVKGRGVPLEAPVERHRPRDRIEFPDDF